MNTDMPAFTAFALESIRPARQLAGDCQTLTLQTARAPAHASCEPMAGSVRVNGRPAARANQLCAAVVPADGAALTITF